ncbi:protein BatD [Parashewanella curva]|uniref:Protein BatD n=1 Tax=Parashewanella curva TaxID=2338552 RepID=A0A3L8Q0N4_9GAMM|nr:BatD family protein [Parashewanella curva]RLV60358.1 protein BatD [Parashewanella curva]
MVKRLLTLFILLVSTSSPALAITKIESSVDRNPVVKGEYFILNVTADDEVEGKTLNTSALLKDFIVGRTSVSRSTQIINFDAKRETRWQILLAPKHKGIVKIPSFEIDNVKSNEIALQVVSDANAKQKNKDVYIITSLNHQQGYVGQLLLYTMKLYLAVDLQRGALNAPNIEDAQVKQIGNDKDTTEIVNGRRFRVIERTYGVIPNKAGKLEITGAGFSGDVLTNTQPSRGLFGFNESRPVLLNAKPQSIQILPKPADYYGDWLVSDLVVLKETWPENKNVFEVGSPITRTIKILASNTDDTSVPTLNLSYSNALKSYPEKPVRKTYVRGNSLVAEVSQTVAIVPTKPGSFTLPEVRVPWWNPIKRKQEFAILPAKTIKVIGSVPASATQEPIAPPQTATTPAPVESAGYWPWVSLVLALLWLFSTFMWWRQSRQPNTQEMAIPRASAQWSDISIKEIEQAFEAKEYGKVLTLLQKYASQLQGTTLNLSQVSQVSTEVQQVIEELQAAQYGKGQCQLTAKALREAIESLNASNAKKNDNHLTPLNP